MAIIEIGGSHSMPLKISTVRKTHLPKAASGGFQQYSALPGDWIHYRASLGTLRYAKVIGQIVAGVDAGGKSLIGQIAILAIADSMSNGYLRVIDAADIESCMRPAHAAKFLGWLIAADPVAMLAYCADDLATRQAASYCPQSPEEWAAEGIK